MPLVEAKMAEDTLPEESEYPLSMKQVLFSFKGRITRREYWMKGFVPVWLFAIVFSALLSGTSYYTTGKWLFTVSYGLEVRPGNAKPVAAFKKVGKNIVGKVNLDTGPARARAEVVFDVKTKLLVRNYLVGTQPLTVTTTQTGARDKTDYQVELLWTQYPKPVPPPPPPLLAKVLTAVLGVFYVFLLWPYAALLVKRGHDWDKKGWWALIFIIPLVNIIWLIVLGVVKGTDGENRFGPNPLDAGGG